MKLKAEGSAAEFALFVLIVVFGFLYGKQIIFLALATCLTELLGE